MEIDKVLYIALVNAVTFLKLPVKHNFTAFVFKAYELA